MSFFDNSINITGGTIGSVTGSTIMTKRQKTISAPPYSTVDAPAAARQASTSAETLATASTTVDTLTNTTAPQKSMQCRRHNRIVASNEGLESGTVEMKPPNTAIGLIEIDRSRIAESLKKQLHRRLYTARSPRELCTFGMLVFGNKLELTMMNLTASGSYDYRKVHDANLSTTFDDYAFINETLEIVCSFVRLVEASLPTNEDKAHDLILPDYSSFIKPTVYVTNIEDA